MHNLFVSKINLISALGGAKMSLDVEFTYVIIASLSGGITFCTVKNALNFSNYFSSMVRVQERYAN
jgi:hypothetical protein